MNDSNYASMVIQFGVFLALLFMLLILAVAFPLLRQFFRGGREPWVFFGLAYAVVCVIGAVFGPAFEIRNVSILLWLGLFGAAMALKGPLERPAESVA